MSTTQVYVDRINRDFLIEEIWNIYLGSIKSTLLYNTCFSPRGILSEDVIQAKI